MLADNWNPYLQQKQRVKTLARQHVMLSTQAKPGVLARTAALEDQVKEARAIVEPDLVRRGREGEMEGRRERERESECV